MPDDQLTRREVDRIAEEAAERATERVFQRLGVDAEGGWQEMQRDFDWVRTARQGSESVRTSVRKGITYGGASTVGAGIVYLIWRIIEMASKAKGGP